MEATNMPKVLMGVRQDGNTLTLRIDQDRLLEGYSGEFPVIDLILFGCEQADETFALLSQATDRAFDYEVHKESEDKWVRLAVEGQASDRTLHCAGIIEVGSEYTLADWTQKCRRLVELNRQNGDQAVDFSRRYHSLKSHLENEVTTELERVQRRLLLVDPSATEKAAALSAQMQVYQHILEIIKNPEGKTS